MKSLKKIVKSTMPATIQRFLGGTWDGLQRSKQWPSAALHPWRRETNRKLDAMKDIHRGERCFIIGNGPSLKHTDLSKIRDEYTFGMNRFYLAFSELGFQTTYFLSINDLVVEQSADEIADLEMPFFISWRARKWIAPSPNCHHLFTTYTGPKFARDIRGRLWEGATVTYVAMQIAFFLGFQQVILIGVDHNFVTKGEPNKTIISKGDDQNHFHPGYFGKGFRWQLPDLETSERSYGLARQVFENHDREILDATVGGKLAVFPKVAFEKLF